MADLRQGWRDRDERERNSEDYWGMGVVPEERVNPARLAYDAKQRGDVLFQVELPISRIEGAAWMGSAGTRTVRVEAMTTQTLNEIEQQGWKLEHVSTTFVETGSSSTKRVLANAGSVELATHGMTVGLYVFRVT